MARIAENLTDLIGRPSLPSALAVDRTEGHPSVQARGVQSGGSGKNRIAWPMIQTAEECGLISHRTIPVEPTDGNIGIGWPSYARRHP